MTRTLEQLVATDRLTSLRDAIVAGLGQQFSDVAVVAHPGNIDLYDAVKRAVVTAPGVAIGWSRVQAPREIDGSFVTPIKWAAYIIAEDYTDPVSQSVIPRDVVANAIGSRVLQVLHDPDLSSWGLSRVTNPDSTPGPQLRPMFTAQTYDELAAYYAVTWTQSLTDLGPNFLEGATPELAMSDGEDSRPGVKFPSDDEIPTEIRALIETGSEA